MDTPKKRRWKPMFKYAIAALAAVLVAAVAIRARAPQSPPPDGGTVTYRDSNAPKVIQSKEITALSTYFYCLDRYTPNSASHYAFEIVPEGDLWRLTLSGTDGASAVIDREALSRVQAIIDEYKLAEHNGIYRVTAGLPVQFSPCSLNADYASGENLNFTLNGSIDRPWCIDLRNCFFDLFAEAGLARFQPPKEAITIDACSIAFSVGDIAYSYDSMEDEDGKTRYCRTEYDMAGQEESAEAVIDFHPDIYRGLQQVIEDCHLESLTKLIGTDFDFHMPHTTEGYLEITIDYENGRKLWLQAAGDRIPEEWYPMREALKEYLDALFVS